MYNFIEKYYKLKIESSLKISSSTYKLKTSQGDYILKEVKDDSLDKLYNRLLLSHCDDFVLPLKGFNNKYVQKEDEKYYILSTFIDDESILGEDLKLSFYIKSIAKLHKNTSFYINIQDNYLDSTLNYLDEQIKKVSNDIQARIEVIEQNSYHSPNDWYFLMNYPLFQNAIESASKHVLNFENGVKEQKKLHLSLTYQNFDFSHIILKHEKLISLEKMGFNLCVNDVYDMIRKCNNSLNIASYIKEYLSYNPLLDYEKEYLMALLCTFDYERYSSTKEDLKKLIDLVNYLNTVISLESEVIFSSPSEE